MQTILSSNLTEFQKTHDVMAAFRNRHEADDVAVARSKRTGVVHTVVKLEYNDGSVDLNAKTISEQRLGVDYLVVVEKML